MNSVFKEIFKLQRPVYPPDSDMVLVHNKNRSTMFQKKMSEDEVKELFGEREKIFVFGQYVFRNEYGKEDLIVLGETDWQSW